MKDSLLYRKVYGALVGSAIGDAMGGPVEFWSPADIEKEHGRVDRFLPYVSIMPSAHGPWTMAPGSYTDDSRMSKLLCDAAIDAGHVPNAADVRKAFCRHFHAAASDLEKEFLEEYYYKAIYGEGKQVFGGLPTNAGVMAIAPFGVLCPCDPSRALAAAFDAIFYVEGYARYSAAICAAAVSSAMRSDATPDGILSDALDAVRRHKSHVEGPLWSGDPMYAWIGRKNENLIHEVGDLARRHGDTKSLREELLPLVAQAFGSDGAESMSIGFAMFLAAGGDFRGTVEGCVGFGRDNDSSASFGGALAGALCGIDGIPSEWVDRVEEVNPEPTFASLAEGICAILEADHNEMKSVVDSVDRLMDQRQISMPASLLAP